MLVRLLCKCGNIFQAYVDAFGVYYCDVCECHHEISREVA